MRAGIASALENVKRRSMLRGWCCIMEGELRFCNYKWNPIKIQPKEEEIRGWLKYKTAGAGRRHNHKEKMGLVG